MNNVKWWIFSGPHKISPFKFTNIREWHFQQLLRWDTKTYRWNVEDYSKGSHVSLNIPNFIESRWKNDMFDILKHSSDDTRVVSAHKMRIQWRLVWPIFVVIVVVVVVASTSPRSRSSSRRWRRWRRSRRCCRCGSPRGFPAAASATTMELFVVSGPLGDQLGLHEQLHVFCLIRCRTWCWFIVGVTKVRNIGRWLTKWERSKAR